MAMNADHDALCADVERLLNAESETDNVDVKRNLVDTAISKATALVQQSPNNADFHYLHGLAWYHHPDKSDARLTNIRSAFQRALSIEPQHHFSNQYLGYTNFDAGDYGIASVEVGVAKILVGEMMLRFDRQGSLKCGTDVSESRVGFVGVVVP
ncbi:MAG: hypothetical protein AAF497_05605, partial [Planctomycetota bacterium]